MTISRRLGFLLAAAVLVASCGGGGSSTPTTPSTGGAAAVSIVQGARTLTTTAYSPNPVTVSVGTTVTWTNNDSITHTATSDGGVFNGTVAAGAQYSYPFQSKGTFTYHCTLHPGMVGSVIVQ